MKKWGIIAAIFITCCVLFAWQYYQGQSYTTMTVWRGWQGEAKDDGYYLAKTLLKHHGNEIKVSHSLPPAEKLGTYQVLITDIQFFPEAEDSKQIKAWVEAGGTLFFYSAPWKVYFGETVKEIDNQEKGSISVWEGKGQRFKLEKPKICRQISLPQGQSIGVAKTSGGCELLHRFQLEDGQIIFHTGLSLWHDGSHLTGIAANEDDIPILQGDHAAFLAFLVGENKNILWLKSPQQVPSFTLPTRWIVPILFALLALIFLIWRVGSRFGVLLTFERSKKANLELHLQAAGDLLIAVGAEEALLHASRERLRAELPADYQPFLPDRERLTAALERDFALAPSLVGEALYRQDGKFILKMRAIEKVRTAIGRSK